MSEAFWGSILSVCQPLKSELRYLPPIHPTYGGGGDKNKATDIPVLGLGEDGKYRGITDL